LLSLQNIIKSLQEIKPTLEELKTAAVSLLKGTEPDHETTKSFEDHLEKEEEKYNAVMKSAASRYEILKAGM